MSNNFIKLKKSIIIVNIISILILILYKPNYKSNLDTQLILIYSSIFLILFLTHLLTQKKQNWLRIDILFLLGFGIVHFQWAIMISFSNLKPELYLFFYNNSFYFNYATWLSTISIASWFLGYALIKEKEKEEKKNIYYFQYKKLLYFTILMFTFFIITAGSNFLTGGVYKGQGGSSTGGGISVYFQLLTSISILLLSSIIIYNNQYYNKNGLIKLYKNIDKKFLSLIIIYILLFLSVGDRGTALQVILALLILFGTFIRPIKLKEFIIIIILGAVILTLVGLGRSSTTGDNILVAGAKNAKFNSNYEITLELANSVRTLHSSLANVPKNEDFFLGQLFLSKILSVIPLSQNIYMNLSDEKIYKMGSASYITFLRYGEKPPSGEGTTLIADIYLNFGTIGTIFIMFMFGLFLKKIQNEFENGKKFNYIIIATMIASLAFYLGRGSLFEPLRPALWGIIIYIIFVKKEKINL